jgi:CheY-like chemotaxis protein
LTCAGAQVNFAVSPPFTKGHPLARKILLADDSVTAQNMGRKILTDAGYEVVTVNNGSAALKKIAEHKPDLIVLDVYMPGYSGLEVCQRIKENRETSRIPVLLTVGKLEPFKPEEARRARADAFVVKPFEASELLTALTKLEDKIIPQPEPYKQGRFAKAVASVDQDSETEKVGDSDEGWKARLRIPKGPPKARDAELDPDYAGTQGKGFRDFVETPAKKSQPRPSEADVEFERPLPAGLPHDITPEEIAAITAAAAQLSGAAPDAVTSAEEARADIAETHAEVITQESTTEEAAPVTFASSPETSEAQAEPMSSQVPVEGASAGEAVKPEQMAGEAATPESPLPEGATYPALDEAVSAETANGPSAVVETSDPVPQAEEPRLEAPPEAVPAAVAEAPQPVSIPEGSEIRTSATVDATPVTGTAAVVPEMPPLTAPAPPGADDEVMAALQTLIPSAPEQRSTQPSHAQSASEPRSSAFAAAAAAADVTVVRAHSAGPRWIAEEVALATDEATLSLEKEMEKAYAVFAAQTAPNAAVAFSSAMVESETGASAAIAEAPTVPAPQIADPPVVYAMASAAAAGEGAARMSAVNTPAMPESTVVEAPVKRHLEEISEPAYAASEGQAVTEDPNIGTDIVGGTEIMAANWKNIRDSIAGAAAKPAPAKEEFREAEPVKSEPEAAPAVAVTETVTASSGTDPKAIASIVDSVLAELRPRIVEEIARKLADPKKD